MNENETNKKEHTTEKPQETGRVPIKQRRKKSQGGAAAAALRENKSMLLLFAVIVAALMVILIGILALDMSAVPVCAVVLIETGMAACLHDVPIWLHGLVVVLQIVVGALCGCLIFTILGGALYLLGIVALKFIRD